MTGEGVSATVAEELASARDELEAADALCGIGKHRIALGRAYFAVFHALRARLYAAGHEPRTHAGTRHLFDLHFVKTGRFPPETSRIVARLQKFREEADYAVVFVVDDAGARAEIAAARDLVARLERDMTPAA